MDHGAGIGGRRRKERLYRPRLTIWVPRASRPVARRRAPDLAVRGQSPRLLPCSKLPITGTFQVHVQFRIRVSVASAAPALANGCRPRPRRACWRAPPRCWRRGRTAPPPPRRRGGRRRAVAATGLGEGARLMLRGDRRHWAADLAADSARRRARPARRPRHRAPGRRAAGAARQCAAAAAGAAAAARARCVRGRRVIGYWAWELPAVPPDWRVGLPFVHEIWVPSPFTADALRGCCRPAGCAVRVPIPLAVAPPRRRAGPRRVRAAGGRGGGAGVVQPGLVLRAQEPAGRDRRVPGRVRRPRRPAAAAEDRQSASISRPISRALREAVARARNIRLETRNPAAVPTAMR